jgi:predicted nuclease of predicted toxin-antitoxin system
MRAKLDENMPIEAVDLVRAAGWDCETVYDEGLSGVGDSDVAEVCQPEGRVLFTLDLDFADIRAYPPSEYLGSSFAPG